MRIKAYAKINLSLKVNGTLENGYHDLSMINTRINLFDIIHINIRKKDSFWMSNNLCETKDNIAYKMYCVLKEKFLFKNCYSIKIYKKIPSGAGLAGGSADAAAVLLAINKLEHLNLNQNELIDLAIKIGADVPYCLFNSVCLVEGIGEKINPINIENRYEIILASPGVSISTKNIFTNYIEKDSGRNIRAIIANNSMHYDLMFNDLEETAKLAYPEYKLDKIKSEFIKNGAMCSLMSGSGSAVFALFESKDKTVSRCIKKMKETFPKIIFRKCKTISY